VTRSDWLCTLEKDGQDFALRLGMRFVHGLRAEIAQAIVCERAIRPFISIDDLKLRVPAIQKAELTMLAGIGALNFIAGRSGFHRRDALWQVERAARRAGSLFEKLGQSKETWKEVDKENGEESGDKNENVEILTISPLQPMTSEERLIADFDGTSMTVGPHPMGYHRKRLNKQGVRSASELSNLPNGMPVRIAGAVIARQRPGTAKGFVFLSLEDETGIANAIVTPQTYEKYHLTIVHRQFLLIEGELQNQDNVISVKAEIVWPLSIAQVETGSHDFH
jgi:error-prone DNA polymerase